MRPEAAAHLWDAMEAAHAAYSFVAEVDEADYLADLMRRSAVERQLEVLGEALNRLRRCDEHTASRVPDLTRIIGMRNVIAHDYARVDDRLVWAAAATRMPPLIKVLESLVDEASRVHGDGGAPPRRRRGIWG